MKRMYRFLFLFAILCWADKAFSQTQSNDPNMIVGHFEIDTVIGSQTNHINVNYVLSPMPFTTNMNVQLNTANNVVFNVDILDAANNVVATWTPSAISNSYNTDINISSLADGNYHLNIRKYGTSAVLYTVGFVK